MNKPDFRELHPVVKVFLFLVAAVVGLFAVAVLLGIGWILIGVIVFIIKAFALWV